MPDKPIQPQIQFITSDKYIKMYSNSVQLTVTPWDFTFSFGEIKLPMEKPTVENQVGIVMSPQHAKALANILVGHVREYEKKVGEIKLPTEEPPATVEAVEPKTH